MIARTFQCPSCVQSEEESERLVRTTVRKADWRHRDMLRYADSACEEFCARPTVVSCGITREYGLPDSSCVPYEETAIPVHDGAMTPEHGDVAKSSNPHSGFGFAITDAGLWCRFRKDGANPVFTSWDKQCIRADGIPLAYYDGDGATAEALLALCRDLHAKARELYGAESG